VRYLWHRFRGPDERYGPAVGIRPWRIACGVFLGLSLGVKWSALYTVLGFAILALAWDIGARRTARVPAPVRGALRRDLNGFVLGMVVTPIVTFLATWSGWLFTDRGWNRHTYGGGPGAAWQGWWEYQMAIYHFHNHLDDPHPYQSTPVSWLVMGRPVAYYYKPYATGEGGCGSPGGCSREVLALGNPAIWWVGVLALLVVLGLWASRRDWRASLVLIGFSSSFLPWLAFPNRTMFFFYAMPLLPFLVLGLTATAGLVLGPRGGSDVRRLVGALTVGVYAIIVVLVFVYFYPILAAQVIPTSEWRARMWFPGWV
jgi:dolichyl-phosphate-mannose--protein O-mannosyl transferase